MHREFYTVQLWEALWNPRQCRGHRGHRPWRPGGPALDFAPDSASHRAGQGKPLGPHLHENVVNKVCVAIGLFCVEVGMQSWSSRQKAKGRRRPGVEANGTAWNQETVKNRLGEEADLVGKGRAKGRRGGGWERPQGHSAGGSRRGQKSRHRSRQG